MVADNSYFVNATSITQVRCSIEYTAAAVKISKANSDMISKHIKLLTR